jgi:hypothetical protein
MLSVRPRVLAGVGAAVVPFLVLLAGAETEDTPAQQAFRARPYNRSYELMTCAVGTACGLAACLESALGRWQGRLQRAVSRTSVRGLATDTGAALGIFLGTWSLAQTILNGVIGCAGAAVLWFLLAFLPAAWSLGKEVNELLRTTTSGSRMCRLRWCGRRPVTCAGAGLRAVLTIFAIGLLAVPAFLPWDGPPEPFIRWHAYSVDGELLWRGTFVSFAVGNLTAAVLQDPAGLGASYTLFFIFQCILHATVMLVDNRVAAVADGPNGNPEHIWSEIPGFYFIGTVLALLLATRLRVIGRPSVEEGGQGQPGEAVVQEEGGEEGGEGDKGAGKGREGP